MTHTCFKGSRKRRGSRTILSTSLTGAAVKYLNGDPPYNDRATYPLPGVILLDLRMPRVDGFEVLAWLQQHPDIAAHIPVVVLSGSFLAEDVRRARQLGAASYEVKPLAFQELIEIARRSWALTRNAQSQIPLA
jgi:CheY-like chemotaxis protein